MGTSFTEIKKWMEKDVDEVGKIARNVRANLEGSNGQKCINFTHPALNTPACSVRISSLSLCSFCCFLIHSELRQSKKAWL